MTPSADDYREAVSNGAALLDARVPGWRDRVDVTTLNLGSCEHCTLGQLFGDYDAGRRFLELDDVPESNNARAALYGFSLPLDDVFYDDRPAHWDALRLAWWKEAQR